MGPWEREYSRSEVPLPGRCPGREAMALLEGQRLAVEIGPGVGFHPLSFSLDNPDWKMVAIEHTAEKFKKFERRYENHGRPGNLLPVHANAISWITHNLKDKEVDRFFLLYPNPYPKTSDEKKRWYVKPFMQELVRCLKPQGELIVASNYDWYVDRAVEFLADRFELVERHRITKGESRPWTHFEKKYLEEGMDCHRLFFRLKDGFQ